MALNSPKAVQMLAGCCVHHDGIVQCGRCIVTVQVMVLEDNGGREDGAGATL